MSELNDYLLCGEDLEGQTVIELDSGRRVDFVSEARRDNGDFICATYYPSPDGRLIVIEGCFWACPFEVVFCRFHDPMALPWPEIDRMNVSGEPQGWTNDGFLYESSEEVRVTDLKPFHELSQAERDEFRKQWRQIGGKRIRRRVRRSDGSDVVVDERIVPNKP